MREERWCCECGGSWVEGAEGGQVAVGLARCPEHDEVVYHGTESPEEAERVEAGQEELLVEVARLQEQVRVLKYRLLGIAIHCEERIAQERDERLAEEAFLEFIVRLADKGVMNGA